MWRLKTSARYLLPIIILLLLLPLPVLAIQATTPHQAPLTVLLPTQLTTAKQENASGWPVQTGGAVESSPALGDIDCDGQPEVVVGSADGKVWAFNGDGSNASGWPVQTGDDVRSSPALGDIDGDGLVEIVVGSFDGYVWAFNTPGPGVPVFLFASMFLIMQQQQMSPLLLVAAGVGVAVVVAVLVFAFWKKRGAK